MSVYAGPNTIQNGLLLHIDPSNPRSYPGSGNTIFDISGNGNNATLTNGASVISQRSGRALDFDGVNDYVDCGNNSTLNPTSNISAAAWVFPSALSDVYTCIIGRDDASLGRSFMFGQRYQSGGLGNLWLQINGNSTLVGNSAIPKNTWSHVSFTGNSSSGYRVFLNGREDGTAAWLQPNTTTGSTTIARRTYTNSEYSLPGQLDDVRLYNRALSPQEIINNFNATRGRYGI